MEMATAFWKKPFHSTRRHLARAWFQLHPQIRVIGVTGSYGKTSTACAITALLSEKFPTLQTDLNLDTVYNLPMTLLKVRQKHKFVVLEMGVDHKGEMDSYLALVRPQIGIVTGITPVHSEPELLGSLAGITEEKGKLLESLPKDGWAILNHDDENVQEMAQKTKAKVLWYGIEKRPTYAEASAGECDFWADDIKVGFEGTSFNLYYKNPFSQKESSLKEVKIPLLGMHFVQSALAAFAVGLLCGLNEEEVTSGFAKLTPLSGRMSLEKGPLGITILDDHLRANPASTISGLETLSLLPHHGRKIAILGEMGELGRYAEEEHRKIGEKASKLKIDFLIGIGPLQKLVIEEAAKAGFSKNRLLWVKNVREAADFLRSYLKGGELIYLKGSLLRHIERVILILEGKDVSCNLVVCHRYESCQTCPNLSKVG